MAYQKKGVQDKTYIADYKSDLASIPSVSMGSTCWVIETAEKYMANSKGEWVLQTISTNGHGSGGGGGDIDLSKYATIEYSDSKDEDIMEIVEDINQESTVWNQL